jgi:hypothetical protein
LECTEKRKYKHIKNFYMWNLPATRTT